MDQQKGQRSHMDTKRQELRQTVSIALTKGHSEYKESQSEGRKRRMTLDARQLGRADSKEEDFPQSTACGTGQLKLSSKQTTSGSGNTGSVRKAVPMLELPYL